MKFKQLDLLRFGCFTGRTLTFSERGLQVIYGLNEAGKSTALRAVASLLFGIPARSTDAFGFETRELRIKATLENEAGDERTVIRRKGNKDTLLGLNERPIADSALAPFLNGVTEEVFETLFRLDQHRLSNGGEDLRKGAGSLAQAIFQAGSGIAGLKEILGALDEEADRLFRPRASASAILQATARYEEARKQIKERALPAAEWKEKTEQLTARTEEFGRIEQELRRYKQEKERLKRILEALPTIAERKDVLVSLQALGDFTTITPEQSKARADAELQQREANQRKENTREKIDHIQAQLDTLPRDEHVLLHAAAITNLVVRIEAYKSASIDVIEVEGKRQQLTSEAARLLQEVRPGAALDAAESFRLSITERNRIRDLAGEHGALTERVRSGALKSVEIEDGIAAEQKVLSELPVDPGIAALEGVLEEVHGCGNLEANSAKEFSNAVTLRQDCELALKQLPLWRGSLAELEAAAIPSIETIDRFDSELLSQIKVDEQLKDEAEKCLNRLREVKGSIDTLTLGQNIPTESDLLENRQRRERGWKLVRQAWLENKIDPAATAAFDPERPLPEAYEGSVQQADDTSDRLRHDAERVGHLARFKADQERLESAVAELDCKRLAVGAQRASWQKNWDAAWAAANFMPLPPREMRAWLGVRRQVLELSTKLRATEANLNQAQDEIVEKLHLLSEALASAGYPAVASTEKLTAVIRAAKQHIRNVTTAATIRADHVKEKKRLEKEQVKTNRELESERSRLEKWQQDWATAVATLGLPLDAGPLEAMGMLDKLEQLFSALKEATDRSERVNSMRRTIAYFEQEALKLIEAVSPGYEASPDAAVAHLERLLAQARKHSERRDLLNKGLQRELSDFEKSEADLKQAQAVIASLLESSGASDLAEVRGLEEKSESFRQLQEKRLAYDRILAGRSAGATIDSFLAEVASISADQVPSELTTVEQQIHQLETQRSVGQQAIWEIKRALEVMNGGAASAVASEEAQSYLAEIRTHSERYARLRLASGILRRQIERYREQNEDPIIAAASRIFPKLTVGSFKSLRSDFDDKDKPILLGVRPNGEQVTVEGMSDGTRDQLFLSLKLASLQQQLAHSEPFPLIFDDILVNFDDQRAAATLKVFAEFATRTQILFFTHHERLVDLARENLDSEIFQLHDLDAIPVSRFRSRSLVQPATEGI